MVFSSHTQFLLILSSWWSESRSVLFRLYSLWNSPGQNTGVGSLSLLQGNLPNPATNPRSPTLQADSLPAEPQGKPKNTGVGCQSFLQWIFPTQESNRGFLHCRQILHQLSYLLGRETISGPQPFITRHRLNFFFLYGENMLFSYDLADWD